MSINKKIDYHPNFYVGNYYHVYNRAAGMDKLFFNKENYKHFLRRYSYYLGDKLRTYAFCLLPNHFHMLVSPMVNDSELIIEHFRKFFISYSMTINYHQKRKGNLFQSNFKRKIIDDESYLIQVIYYLHANPLHHSIMNDFENYPYSSYKKIISNNITRLRRAEVLSWFNGKNNFIEYHKELKKDIFTDYFAIEDD
jgi:REP element-mobilizing transposase RayT